MLENTQLVPDSCEGERLDIVLAKLFPSFSRTRLSTWLKEGKITLNQKRHLPKDKVPKNSSIECHVDFENVHSESVEAEEIPLDIVYEDETLICINKPQGLVVHPGAGNQSHTLLNALLFHDKAFEKLPRAGIIHRLDKDTTGLLIAAKTFESHARLVQMMQTRLIERRYLALVHGNMISGGTLTTSFGRDMRNRLKMSVRTHGKEATTHYTIEQRLSHHTLLEVRLETGRTHQIRVHMAHLKHPVVGDPLYGGRMRFSKDLSPEARIIFEQFKRQALHARTLQFDHPLSGEPLVFHAPIPDDFKILLETLSL